MPTFQTHTAYLSAADVVDLLNARTDQAAREHDNDALHALIGVLCDVDRLSKARSSRPAPRPERGIVRSALDTRPLRHQEARLMYARYQGDPDPPESAFVPDPPDHISGRVRFVQSELDALNELPHAPIGGWYSEAIRRAASRLKTGAYELDRLVRDYVNDRP